MQNMILVFAATTILLHIRLVRKESINSKQKSNQYTKIIDKSNYHK